MLEPFRIHLGDQLPVQQTQFTCGSASLTVARMLVDPGFARWIVHGDRRALPLPLGDTEDERAAAFEEIVIARTNSVFGPGGRIQLPWPRRLGTPPWGAKLELETGAATAGVRFVTRWCRLGGETRMRRHHDEIRERVGAGRPAVLYIGSTWLPRHVTLVVPSESTDGLDVYDPASGQVEPLPADSFATRRLHIAGWDVPWCVVLPRSGTPKVS